MMGMMPSLMATTSTRGMPSVASQRSRPPRGVLPQMPVPGSGASGPGAGAGRGARA